MKSNWLALALAAAVLAMLSVCGSASAAFQPDSISAGWSHNCAIRSSGQAVCWGSDTGGKLGDGTAPDGYIPTQVQGLTDAVSISADKGHTCAIRASGQTLCWGDNMYGQLGDGTTSDRDTPSRVLDLTAPISVSTGYDHTCAIRSSGQAVCWGYSSYGQLGTTDLNSTFKHSSPIPVQGLNDAKSISAGADHTCAIRKNREAICWGDNAVGQLGDGSQTQRPTPVPVQDLTDAVSISAGWGHTCAIRSSGQAVCWGINDYGQIGDGIAEDGIAAYRDVPTPVSGLTDAKSISAGEYHTCAIRSSGQAVCWGNNEGGELGDGTTTERLVPTPVKGLTDAVSIGAGEYHTCAIRSSGQAVCWGGNDGALGDGTWEDRLTPTPVIDSTEKPKPHQPVQVIPVKGGFGRYTVSCPQSKNCAGSVVVERGKTALTHKRHYSVAANGRKKIKLKLTKAGKKALGRSRRVRATLVYAARSGPKQGFPVILKRR